ncbi:MAG: sensitivity to high expression protein she9 [Candelina submexicana]|nr:MAG: sensitivity to high expression protein she9 [Candelina submexicana]
MDHLQSNIFIAGQRLNDLTGYSGIEALKREIEEQEELLRTSRASVRNYKDAYSKAIAQRSASQREVNELLQRKQTWSNNDLDRFTVLFTSDHANEQAETAAQEALASAERSAEEASTKLSKSILARYHEEQIWSDKIRRMSTWGTWGLMGVNVLLFLVFQIGVEPWRRKRLVKGFEEKVMEALEREGAANSTALISMQEKVNQSAGIRNEDQSALPTEVPHATSDVIEDVVPNAIPEVTPIVAEAEATAHQEFTATQPGVAQSPEPAVPPLHTSPLLLKTSILGFSQEYLKDLFSNRLVQLRKLDVTYIALEGAAAGAALVGIVVVLLRPK